MPLSARWADKNPSITFYSIKESRIVTKTNDNATNRLIYAVVNNIHHKHRCFVMPHQTRSFIFAHGIPLT